MLEEAHVFFRANWERAATNVIPRRYNEYGRLPVSPEPARGTDLDTLFDQDLLRAQITDSVEVPEEC